MRGELMTRRRARPPNWHVAEGDPRVRAAGIDLQRRPQRGQLPRFDESAIWCVQVIDNLRALGLTIKEIRELAGVYLERPREPIGPRLSELPDRAEQRIEQHREQLEAIQRRIRAFR